MAKKRKRADRPKGLSIPELFPKLETIGRYMGRREYVAETAVRLIQSEARGIREPAHVEGGDEFHVGLLTMMMCQDMAAFELLGQVILGHGIDDGQTWGAPARRQFTNVDVPEEIEQYKVHLIAISDDFPTVRWTDGMKATGRFIAGRQRRRHPQVQRVEKIIDTGKPEYTATMRQAFLCLKEWGEYARPASHPDDQAHLWRYREEPKELVLRSAEPEPPPRSMRTITDSRDQAGASD